LIQLGKNFGGGLKGNKESPSGFFQFDKSKATNRHRKERSREEKVYAEEIFQGESIRCMN